MSKALLHLFCLNCHFLCTLNSTKRGLSGMKGQRRPRLLMRHSQNAHHRTHAGSPVATEAKAETQTACYKTRFVNIWIRADRSTGTTDRSIWSGRLKAEQTACITT
ncbi:hypothetical protein AAFF_G00064080 [Aldrovandia affinis]|uniref:Secreted protein n=1 Tax=Aldrovandia affinis TaxID=143900 RepID=A0AAD7T3M4_9TELE|nr:hypothetical protein AAFF_G00064080 [Aldrovandia affinis]